MQCLLAPPAPSTRVYNAVRTVYAVKGEIGCRNVRRMPLLPENVPLCSEAMKEGATMHRSLLLRTLQSLTCS